MFTTESTTESMSQKMLTLWEFEDDPSTGVCVKLFTDKIIQASHSEKLELPDFLECLERHQNVKNAKLCFERKRITHIAKKWLGVKRGSCNKNEETYIMRIMCVVYREMRTKIITTASCNLMLHGKHNVSKESPQEVLMKYAHKYCSRKKDHTIVNAYIDNSCNPSTMDESYQKILLSELISHVYLGKLSSF